MLGTWEILEKTSSSNKRNGLTFFTVIRKVLTDQLEIFNK